MNISSQFAKVLDDIKTRKNSGNREKKLTISTPRNDFQHMGHIGINGESFGNIVSMTKVSGETPDLIKNAIKNSQTSEKKGKKIKSPVLVNSVTIVRPDRPNILRRRIQESESEDEELVLDHSDLMESVLAVMEKDEHAPEKENFKQSQDSLLDGSEIEHVKVPITNYESAAAKYEDNEYPSDDEENFNESSMTAFTMDNMQMTISEPELTDSEGREERLAKIVNRFSPNATLESLNDTIYPSSEAEENHYDLPCEEEYALDSRDSESSPEPPIVEQIKNNHVHIIGQQRTISISKDEEIIL